MRKLRNALVVALVLGASLGGPAMAAQAYDDDIPIETQTDTGNGADPGSGWGDGAGEGSGSDSGDGGGYSDGDGGYSSSDAAPGAVPTALADAYFLSWTSEDTYAYVPSTWGVTPTQADVEIFGAAKGGACYLSGYYNAVICGK